MDAVRRHHRPSAHHRVSAPTQCRRASTRERQLELSKSRKTGGALESSRSEIHGMEGQAMCRRKPSGCDYCFLAPFASYTRFPPIHVESTRVARISVSGIRMMSRSRTTKSAYLPGVREPSTDSWKPAYAGQIVID